MAEEKGINLKFPLRAYRKGFFESNSTTLDAVREDIKVLLLTTKGERLINSDIGTNISVFSGILFDQRNRAEMKTRVENEIREALSKWMPNVTLTSLEIVIKDDETGYGLTDNEILIRMQYVVNNNEALFDSVQLKVTA